MDIILQTVIQYAAELIALILVSALGILGAWIMNKINKNKNLQNIEAATSTVIHAAQDTVLMLQQMYVDDYKEASSIGKLTPEQIADLREKTQQITLEQLGQPVLELLEAAEIDVANLITTAAEAYINRIKRG
jgi:hypothetical protein